MSRFGKEVFQNGWQICKTQVKCEPGDPDCYYLALGGAVHDRYMQMSWLTMEVILGVTVINYTRFEKFSRPNSFKVCSSVGTPVMWLSGQLPLRS